MYSCLLLFVTVVTENNSVTLAYQRLLSFLENLILRCLQISEPARLQKFIKDYSEHRPWGDKGLKNSKIKQQM
jgi:hypothetical protein